jgi:uroporphyrinogen III methyltransferase/synthase
VNGFVYMVGAGPGDPRLLTIRAFELLRSAEVVAHDELVSPEILALVPADAELLNVGHRGGHGPIIPALNSLVIERALRGKQVVRLKCGDPMVFGRGAEEAEDLRKAGIPFEVVPGITAALGAAAYGSLPLTDRRYSSQVTLATGHDSFDQSRDRQTLVIYMGVKNLSENMIGLIRSGWLPGTPAAYISSATRSSQRVVVGTVEDLGRRTAKIRGSAPGLVIVGHVARLRETIEWFQMCPLSGKCILVGRARPGRSQIAAALRAAGATVLEAPRVTVSDYPFLSPIARTLSDRARCEVVVFGCAAGVEVAVRHRLLEGCPAPVLAVGNAAAMALRRHGLEPEAVFHGACSQEINAWRLELVDRRLILLASDRGRPALVAELSAAGASIETIPIYQSYETFPDLVPIPNAVVLPSSSAAQLLLSGSFGDSLRSLPTVAIGERTRQAAERLGASDIIESLEDTVESVIAAVLRLFAANDGTTVGGHNEPIEGRK